MKTIELYQLCDIREYETSSKSTNFHINNFFIQFIW